MSSPVIYSIFIFFLLMIIRVAMSRNLSKNINENIQKSFLISGIMEEVLSVRQLMWHHSLFPSEKQCLQLMEKTRRNTYLMGKMMSTSQSTFLSTDRQPRRQKSSHHHFMCISSLQYLVHKHTANDLFRNFFLSVMEQKLR